MKTVIKFWYIPVIGILLFSNFSSCKSYFEMAKKLSKYNHQDSVMRQKVQTSATILSRKVNKFGLESVTIAEAENILPFKMANAVAVSPGILDTTAMALNIRKKQIESISIINSTLSAENLILKKNLDSLKQEYYTYNDKFLTLKFKPADSSNKDHLLDFKYSAKLNYVQYWKRKFPLIGAKSSFIDIWSDDPRTTVNGVERLKIQQKEPQFGLRLQLRSVYGITTQKLYAGPGLSFDFQRMNLLGYSNYNLTDNRWQYSVGINYDLIRF